MKSIEQFIRENIKHLKPYSSARDEYTGRDAIFLDANENPYNSPYNRYPDPLQRDLKKKIAVIKQVNPESIFLGNGSDEAIDLLIRAFCEPRVDNIITIDPTYGMYQVCADINAVEVRKVPLSESFEINAEAILKASDACTKLIFLCSPNNPTSNSFSKNTLADIIKNCNSLLVLDEAYIDFSAQPGFLADLDNYPNLVILQTFSKAWGLAGIRLGMAFGQKKIIDVLNKIKYPYNINFLTQQKALESLSAETYKTEWVKELLDERNRLAAELLNLPYIIKVYPSDANFLLIKVNKPVDVYNYLVDQKIVIRDRSRVSLCEGCLRITVGTENENDVLLKALQDYE